MQIEDDFTKLFVLKTQIGWDCVKRLFEELSSIWLKKVYMPRQQRCAICFIKRIMNVYIREKVGFKGFGLGGPKFLVKMTHVHTSAPTQ